MKKEHDIYLFGQVLGTHSFLLKDGFLRPDEYSEIGEQYFLPGGETGTAATVLDSLGVSVCMDGTWIGTEVAPMLRKFYEKKNVDISSMCFVQDDPGVMDYVVIAGLVRSPMGRFQTLFSSGKRWWSVPSEEDIAGCKVAAIDPYFGNESLLAAEICVRHNIPFVTIDSMHDSILNKQAAINVVSKECTAKYPGMSPEAVMELMMKESDGLTILTQGEGNMLYGRKGGEIRRMKPFDVEVRSTLGAGDTFKAGCAYALLKGMPDDEIVRFAAACSAVAISRFPLPLNPPKLEEVQDLLRKAD
ncbi:MAG: carbohydrate kinase family protein [Lachnospiraceae bacterium]|nr:carbohydrate kinase family protein [Lachnospiraceae bacterium]